MSDIDDTSTANSGDYSLDADDQLQAEDSLVDRGVDDILDEGISPPERPLGLNAHGLTGDEQAAGETLDQRLAEEEPDPYARLGDPLLDPSDDDESERTSEFPGDDEVGHRRVGRLVAGDEGRYEDEESELFAEDVGIDGGAASAEEAAVHLIEDAD
ncbi:hypothetical protein ABH922_002090 [Rhodococcus sp. 27YEA15]|uniref:DUF5709 domain-containing protein n=1 Tax=Rhodococcus sp. 27YEA15 TaxID=3156259 RepID=UPI003C7C2E6F